MKKRGKDLISYLRGEAFKFFYKLFMINEELTKEGQNIVIVKDALREKQYEKKNLQIAFKKLTSLQLGSHNDIFNFMEAVKVVY